MIKENQNEGVKVRFENPPIYDSVCAAFNIKPRDVFFTYGDTIYNPDRVDIPDHIIIHERVHMEQQNYNDKDAAMWWGKYLRDAQFRVGQEAKAYAKQYSFLCRRVKGREERFKMRLELAGFLSGPLYNNAITKHEAVRLIEQLSGVR